MNLSGGKANKQRRFFSSGCCLIKIMTSRSNGFVQPLIHGFVQVNSLKIKHLVSRCWLQKIRKYKKCSINFGVSFKLWKELYFFNFVLWLNIDLDIHLKQIKYIWYIHNNFLTSLIVYWGNRYYHITLPEKIKFCINKWISNMNLRKCDWSLYFVYKLVFITHYITNYISCFLITFCFLCIKKIVNELFLLIKTVLSSLYDFFQLHLELPIAIIT